MPQTPTASGESRPAADTDREVFRLGAIGVDSSHLPAFAQRLAQRQEEGGSRCRLTGFWTDGHHDMPADEVQRWVAEAEAVGSRRYEDLDKMLDEVDGVLVLSVNGHRHLAHARPALERGLPTYIDKPLACSLTEAGRIRALAEEHGARCYSASSLRFAAELGAVADAALGELVAIDAYGPGELHELMPGTFFYGVHSIEMVDALWGSGVTAVAAQHTDDRDALALHYADGRLATIRLERAGSYDFGATVHGRDGVHSFRVDFATVYDRLIDGMVGFFENDTAPVTLDRLLENIAVMEAANRSMDQGGRWVQIDEVE